ncbi:MAG: hypothetical protein C0520_03910 [Sphingopyxis sp.]|nr:hypothetical protein [Sphingopyxis sp.]
MARFSVSGIVPALALAIATPAWAQGELAVEAGQPWTHAHSGITVPATLGGNVLTAARTYAPHELDLGMSFEPDDARDFLSFYIFRNTNGGVPVWMAQAQWSVENRGIFQGAGLTIAPEAFTPPGQNGASGLKTVYATTADHGYTSTGIALLPVGDWYVKLRATSRDRSPAELARAMDGWLAEIGWPKDASEAPAALPVIACANTLSFKGTSKDASGDGIQDALAAAVASAAAGEGKRQPAQVRWCRDSGLDGNKAVYRADGASNAYLLAAGDNGIGVWIGPSAGGLLAGAKGKGERFGVTLHMAAQDLHFASQDRLPSPQRVMEIVDTGRVNATVATWGDKRQIQINSDAKAK